MKIKPWAQFSSCLPDDHIEDGPEIIQFGGKSVAEAIAGILTTLGCKASPPEYAEQNGWDCLLTFKTRDLFFQVTLIDDYVAIFKDSSSDRNKARPHPDFVEIMTVLGSALGSDARFMNVRWYTDDEVLTDAKGATNPVTG